MIVRSVRERVASALIDTPVVMIVGPRQTGKSTLALEFQGRERRYLTLDDPDLLARARSNPASFLAAYDGPVIIDEIQRAPELLLPIKARIDRIRTPGSYLLTGSANVLALPKVADSLAGRLEVIDLFPLSQKEIEDDRVKGSSAPNFVDQAFGEGVFGSSLSASDSEIQSLAERIVTGGYPEPVFRAPRRREAWFQSYLRTLLDRDVRDIANIDGLTQLPRLLKLIASTAGAALNLSTLVRETGIPHTTITRYLDLLKALYLVDTIPAWSEDLEVRLARTPKAYLVDSGLSCFLCQLDAVALEKDETSFHRQTEVFLATELRRLSSYSEKSPLLMHLRTVKNKEVPFVLETRSRSIVGIDFTLDRALAPKAESRLEYLQSLTPEHFHRGIIFYRGDLPRPVSEKIIALPYSALWE